MYKLPHQKSQSQPPKLSTHPHYNNKPFENSNPYAYSFRIKPKLENKRKYLESKLETLEKHIQYETSRHLQEKSTNYNMTEFYVSKLDQKINNSHINFKKHNKFQLEKASNQNKTNTTNLKNLFLDMNQSANYIRTNSNGITSLPTEQLKKTDTKPSYGSYVDTMSFDIKKNI